MSQSDGRRGSRWRRLSAEVRARRSPCGICGQSIDYEIEDPNHPDAFTVDHKRSWRDHPELRSDPGNLVAAHRRCNSQKGSGQGLPSLGLQSREW